MEAKRASLGGDAIGGSAMIPPPAAKRSKSEEVKESTFARALEAMDERGDNSNEAVSAESTWGRLPAPPLVPARSPLVFQQTELESYQGAPLRGMPGAQAGKVEIVRMYGVTAEGNSVLAHVHGFAPYLYTPAPPGFEDKHLQQFRSRLDSMVKGSLGGAASEFPEAVLGVEILHKASLYGYQENAKRPFLKIYVLQHRFINATRRALEDGNLTISLGTFAYEVYESNIEFNLRFMIDCGVVGMNWIELPAGKYRIRPEANKQSLAQYEVDVAYDDFISHAAEGDWSNIAPLRILSFDIECAGRKGIFPEPKIDPVIQIAAMVQVQGQQKPFVRNVFTLNTCAAIAGSHVLSFQSEKELLEKWSAFVRAVDPDIITGYNTHNFDFPFLMDRAAAIGATRFPYLGRLRNKPSRVTETKFSSKAYGTREIKVTTTEGRLQFDVLQILQRDYKLRSYTLNSVSAHFLSEQKEDVHHSIITDLQNGDDQSRRRLAVYCMKDAYLPLRLLDKLMCIYNYVEMARVTGVPFSYLLARGQQIKVVSQLLRRAREQDLVMPVVRSQGSDEQYEGATVIEPKKGYYDVPVATLDFSSLYPSIMMAHNLCYTTLLSKPQANRMDPTKYIKTPTGDCFVTTRNRKGLLPQILEDLLAARKRAKADLKKEKDKFKRAVLDGRQLALKISANSVYGFTGATVGKLPCLEISSSVTAFGRQMIHKTRSLVEEKYTVANGFSHDAVVVYGDTDSVMIKFGETDMTKVMDLAKEAAEYVTATFVKPINLEFEKVYFPYLLINKKRYAGLYWTRPETYDKMDAKGIVTVRRDNCPLVVTLINTCLRKLLIERDVDGAVTFAKSIISDLLCNRIDISQLVITKALSKTKEGYANKQAHVELAERMRKRDAGSAPAMGDRVAYVIIQARKGAPAYEKSEDPIYVLENNVPLDTTYYLENQLSKPLMGIFEPIMGDKAKSMLTGEHTRVVVKIARGNSGLMKFAQKREACIGCKAVLQKGEKTFCSSCKLQESKFFQLEMAKLVKLEQKFSRLWTQCQRCQGSLHQDVLCSSKDCPIFYMRKKVQKDLRTQDTVMKRFDAEW